MDSYYKKNIPFFYNHRELHFRVSQALFSSGDIDLGTRHLLKTIADLNVQKSEKILDVGCGYGPIGIALKTMHPSSEVHMTDKDALALEYSRQNLQENNLTGVKVYVSLGYDGVIDKDFDLIVSNIPAKVGDRVLTHILKDSKFYLKPGGRMAVVVIDAIGDYVTKELNDPEVKILFKKRWPGYLVFVYEFLPTAEPFNTESAQSFATGIYNRDKTLVFREGLTFTIKTTYNLPEFDTLSYETDILLDSLKIVADKILNTVLVFNPGQGYIPVAISKIAEAKKICLVDRDIQALTVSKENLLSNGFQVANLSLAHQVGISVLDGGLFDCIVGVLDADDTSEVHALYLREAADQISTEGIIIFSSGSTAITRVENMLHREKLLQKVDKRRSKGRSVLVMKRKDQ